MSAWPSTYVPANDPTGSPLAPTWSRDDCLSAGITLAEYLAVKPEFARAFHKLVKCYFRDGGDQTVAYGKLIAQVVPNPNTLSFNAHDFANIFRAAWLRTVRSFSRLIGFNPYTNPANNGWGDPSDATPTLRRCDFPTTHGTFHLIVPNSKGYYAIWNSDFDTLEGISAP
jgi:hypothetical protein